MAIAKVEGAERIYSDDPHIKRFGAADGITVITLEELPLPPASEPDLFNFEKG